MKILLLLLIILFNSVFSFRSISISSRSALKTTFKPLISPLLCTSQNSQSLPDSSSSPDLTLIPPSEEIITPNLTFKEHFINFLKGNWLVLGEVIVILIAKNNPALGASGGILRPEFFISKLGVFAIFFINGVALSLG